MAATLTCILENTCVETETSRQALPATEEPIYSLNAQSEQLQCKVIVLTKYVAGYSPKAHSREVCG
jgi:hypothetical protein